MARIHSFFKLERGNFTKHPIIKISKKIFFIPKWRQKTSKHQKKLFFQHSKVPRMSITTGTGLASKAKLKSYCIAKELKSKIMHQFLCTARSKGNLNFISQNPKAKSKKPKAKPISQANQPSQSETKILLHC